MSTPQHAASLASPAGAARGWRRIGIRLVSITLVGHVVEALVMVPWVVEERREGPGGDTSSDDVEAI